VTRPGRHGYQRTDRVNELLREILADELERTDDERLELVTIMGVEAQSDLERAVVYYSSVEGEAADERIVAGLTATRHELQRAIARQARLRRTPELVFRPDPAVRHGERIEEIIRDLHADE
jgi:ribosome-binding factor A